MRNREGLRIFGLGATCAALILLCSLARRLPIQSARAEEAPPGLEGVPAVVAEVNGQPISREDLVRELAGTSGEQALGRLVRRTLVDQEAAAQHITVTSDEIDAQFNIDKRDLTNELIHTPWVGKDKNQPTPVSDIIRTRFQMSVEEYKKLVVRQKILIRRCVAKDLNPTQDQLLTFFKAYPDYFQPLTKYHASHILISPLDPRDLHVSRHFLTPTGQLTARNRERQDRLKKIELYRENIDIRDDGGIPVEWKNGALPDKILQDIHSGAITWEQAVRQYAEAPTTADLSPEWMKQGALADKVLQDIRAGNITWDQALRTYTKDQLDQPIWNEKKKRTDTERSRFDNPLAPGDLGWFTREGPLVQAFYEGAKNLKPGEIGGPVRTEFGFHLIKMLEVKAELPLQFDQCMDKVEKAFIESEIQKRILPVYSGEGPRDPGWLDLVTAKAAIVAEPMPMSLWPPRKAGAAIDPVASVAPQAQENPDPVVAHVNGVIFHRSDVWRELLRYDSEDALKKLIHREMVLTMLKPMGIARMDWECGRKDLKDQVQAPPLQPIDIGADEIDRELLPDLDRLDAANIERKKQRTDVAGRRKANPDAKDIPEPLLELSFADYIYSRYGRSVAEYRRSLEASAVLMTAVRKKVPVDVKTLKLEFSLARDGYIEPAWFEVSHIQVVPRGGMGNVNKIARQDARIIAESIRQQCADRPENFEALVAEFSEDQDSKRLGGLLGACYADGRPNPNQIRNAADRLSPDDVKAIYSEIKNHNVERGHFTPVIATSRGFHVIRVDAVHPERKMDFKEALPRLIMDYMNEFAKVNCDIWLKELEVEHKARIKRFIGDEKYTLELGHDDIPDGLDIPKPDPPKKK